MDTPDDPTMDRITAAIAASQRGETAQARAAFAAIWHDLGPEADPFHRCTLAHHAADVAADPHAELAWDVLALEAADAVTDERARRYHGSLSIAGFYPSLHLNLARDHLALGDRGRAREHLARARAGLADLPDDGYGRMIRAGIDRLDAVLDDPAEP